MCSGIIDQSGIRVYELSWETLLGSRKIDDGSAGILFDCNERVEKCSLHWGEAQSRNISGNRAVFDWITTGLMSMHSENANNPMPSFLRRGH